MATHVWKSNFVLPVLFLQLTTYHIQCETFCILVSMRPQSHAPDQQRTNATATLQSTAQSRKARNAFLQSIAVQLTTIRWEVWFRRHRGLFPQTTFLSFLRQRCLATCWSSVSGRLRAALLNDALFAVLVTVDTAICRKQVDCSAGVWTPQR